MMLNIKTAVCHGTLKVRRILKDKPTFCCLILFITAIHSGFFTKHMKKSPHCHVMTVKVKLIVVNCMG